MGWFSKRRTVVESPKARRRADAESVDNWVNERRGVEVYVEPKTSLTPVTMLPVAHDGEFTRRLVNSPEAAKSFARHHRIPIYDATIIGYPQRMRDYSKRQIILAQRDRRETLGD